MSQMSRASCISQRSPQVHSEAEDVLSHPDQPRPRIARVHGADAMQHLRWMDMYEKCYQMRRSDPLQHNVLKKG